MSRSPPLSFAGLTDIGLSRPNNEDVWIALPDIGFFAIADGMGGHQAGEIAAKETIEQLSTYLRAPNITLPSNPVFLLRLAIEKANESVYEKGKAIQSLKGMGTTLCCVYWTEGAVIYAHVGDSRIYRLRGGTLQQLTQDHSLFAKWLSMGKQAEECQTPFPYKNVITRAIGTAKRVTPEIAVTPFQPGDLFVLCSDGLSDALSTQDMEKVIARSETLEIAAERLIEKAKIKGSSDNITVLLVEHPDDRKNIFRQQFDDSPRSESVSGNAGRLERSSSEPL